MPDKKTRYEVYAAVERKGDDVRKVWRWRSVAPQDGEILSWGEAYSRRKDAVSLIQNRFLRDGDEIVYLDDLHQPTGNGTETEDYRFSLVHDAVGEPDDEDAKGLDCA